ncbi:MAG: GAF domain-containing protein [Alphaproteobacteria bacterium]|jgi:adenylate cyclase|nr:GAF domain-containing protein [Alphaproteobacteria bacterium]
MSQAEENADTPPAQKSQPRKRRKSPSLLLAVTNRVAQASTLEEQLEVLVEMTVEATEADRGTLFLNDAASGELYARVARGGELRQLTIPNSSGIAGKVFTSGEGILVHDAYAHTGFSQTIDRISGYRTRNLVCAPIRTVRGEMLGVIQCLNKREGNFTTADLELLDAMTTQASIVLDGNVNLRHMEEARQTEANVLKVVTELSTEIQLGPLLQKIMVAIAEMMDADRATLFLNDEKTDELYVETGLDLDAAKFRLPNNAGIAGSVFTTGETINIPYAYADLRFDPSFDAKTSYFTRSILCAPVVNREGQRIGVTQVLNKRGGPFTPEDGEHLRAFTAQISICLENAKLFEDIQGMKNYNDTILESMSNGVLTFDEEATVVTCNAAVQRIMRARASDIVGLPAATLFRGTNSWINERLQKALETRSADGAMDANIDVRGEGCSINLNILPLRHAEDSYGSMMMIEDISSEKRLKSTMSRYMDPSLADRLMEHGQELLGGQSSEATVLFTDVRDFTSHTEELGAQGTVSLLNEYFSIMVDCINDEGGMLDKFIGDAIMAVFGTPFGHEDDEDRAVRTAISMITKLGAYNVRRMRGGKNPIEMGVGINTDEVVSGNIGSPKRMDYTVIGDGVNLASRLEGLCKPYGAKILISENTLQKLRSTYRTRPVDFVVVAGRSKPVAVHEVMDHHTGESFPNLVEVLNRFRDGLAYYREREWQKATSEFAEALSLNDTDKASEVFIERCAHFADNPPPDDWQGEWVMLSK